MRTTVELDEKDIARIIANAFNVDEKSVCLIIEEEWEGQAMMEHKVQTITARVTLKVAEKEGIA